MELKQAIQVLKDHNMWRKGENEELQMTDPKKLGIAIDTVVNKFENLFLSSVVYNKNGMNMPTPEKTHYTIWKFKDTDQEFQIDGRNLVYCQLGSTHHGCQCMHTGDKEEHKLITSKLKQVCDLLNEVDKLNNP